MDEIANESMGIDQTSESINNATIDAELKPSGRASGNTQDIGDNPADKPKGPSLEDIINEWITADDKAKEKPPGMSDEQWRIENMTDREYQEYLQEQQNKREDSAYQRAMNDMKKAGWNISGMNSPQASGSQQSTTDKVDIAKKKMEQEKEIKKMYLALSKLGLDHKKIMDMLNTITGLIPGV